MGCCNYFDMTDRSDNFESWQGLRGERGPVGPQGEPGRDGAGVKLHGPVETIGDLPAAADAGDVWLVGDETPYEGWFWNGQQWLSVGPIIAGPGVPAGGKTGQYLAKNSDDGFDTGWKSPSNLVPLVDGTASAGVSVELSRADHVHPTDTSRAPLASPAFTGVPTAPTAAAGTDTTQIATTAFANKAVSNAVSTYVRPNLLDNWYFAEKWTGTYPGNVYGVFPVNQRGLASNPDAGYSIDRWKTMSAMSVVLNSGYITLSNSSSGNISLTQILPASYSLLAGKKLTCAVLLSGNVLVTGTMTVPTNDSGTTNYHNFISSDSNGILPRIVVRNASTAEFQIRVAAETLVNIVAVKMELGDSQTLVHQEGSDWVLNEIPDYGEQLRRCQRYLWKMQAGAANVGVGVAFGAGTNTAYFAVPHPVEMAVTDNSTIIASSPGAFTLTKTTVAAGYLSTAIGVAGNSPSFASIQITSTGNLASGEAYRCTMMANEYLLISHEP